MDSKDCTVVIDGWSYVRNSKGRYKHIIYEVGNVRYGIVVSDSFAPPAKGSTIKLSVLEKYRVPYSRFA